MVVTHRTAPIVPLFNRFYRTAFYCTACSCTAQETARYIAEVSRECKLGTDPDAYVESFRPFLMDIMYSWSKGASFAEICNMTGVCGRGGLFFLDLFCLWVVLRFSSGVVRGQGTPQLSHCICSITLLSYTRHSIRCLWGKLSTCAGSVIGLTLAHDTCNDTDRCFTHPQPIFSHNMTFFVSCFTCFPPHTDIYEGSVIRATRRLDELLQQLARAARVVGDEAMALHIEAANATIRRDIIFAASLYI